MAMVVARIQFKPSVAGYFCPGESQEVVEMRFESPEALIATMRELEDDIVNCTAWIGNKVLDLRNISGLDPSTC